MRDSTKIGLHYPLARTLGYLMRRKGLLRILTYHSIQSHANLVSHTSPELFEEHVRWLAESGYRSMRVSDLCDRNIVTSSGESQVVITFDDGLYNNYAVARPVLQKYGMTATFFVPTAYIGNERTCVQSNEMGAYRGMEMMCWQDLRSLAEEGFEIGAHSHRHVRIAQESRERARQEVKLPKELLEARLNRTIDSFAYPKGRRDSFAAWTGDLLRECGYRAGCTTLEGPVARDADLFTLPRTDVCGYDDLARFKLKLEGNYDCLNWLRSWRHRIL